MAEKFEQQSPSSILLILVGLSIVFGLAYFLHEMQSKYLNKIKSNISVEQRQVAINEADIEILSKIDQRNAAIISRGTKSIKIPSETSIDQNKLDDLKRKYDALSAKYLYKHLLFVFQVNIDINGRAQVLDSIDNSTLTPNETPRPSPDNYQLQRFSDSALAVELVAIWQYIKESPNSARKRSQDFMQSFLYRIINEYQRNGSLNLQDSSVERTYTANLKTFEVDWDSLERFPLFRNALSNIPIPDLVQIPQSMSPAENTNTINGNKGDVTLSEEAIRATGTALHASLLYSVLKNSDIAELKPIFPVPSGAPSEDNRRLYWFVTNLRNFGIKLQEACEGELKNVSDSLLDEASKPPEQTPPPTPQPSTFGSSIDPMLEAYLSNDKEFRQLYSASVYSSYGEAKSGLDSHLDDVQKANEIDQGKFEFLGFSTPITFFAPFIPVILLVCFTWFLGAYLASRVIDSDSLLNAGTTDQLVFSWFYFTIPLLVVLAITVTNLFAPYAITRIKELGTIAQVADCCASIIVLVLFVLAMKERRRRHTLSVVKTQILADSDPMSVFELLRNHSGIKESITKDFTNTKLDFDAITNNLLKFLRGDMVAESSILLCTSWACRFNTSLAGFVGILYLDLQAAWEANP